MIFLGDLLSHSFFSSGGFVRLQTSFSPAVFLLHKYSTKNNHVVRAASLDAMAKLKDTRPLTSLTQTWYRPTSFTYIQVQGKTSLKVRSRPMVAPWCSALQERMDYVCFFFCLRYVFELAWNTPSWYNCGLNIKQGFLEKFIYTTNLKRHHLLQTRLLVST